MVCLGFDDGKQSDTQILCVNDIRCSLIYKMSLSNIIREGGGRGVNPAVELMTWITMNLPEMPGLMERHIKENRTQIIAVMLYSTGEIWTR